MAVTNVYAPAAVTVPVLLLLKMASHARINVDPDKCIACGACIDACEHDARSFYDDTERFFADLKRGNGITVLCKTTDDKPGMAVPFDCINPLFL